MRFEYMLLEINEKNAGLMVTFADGKSKPAKNLQDVLNSLAEEGWEFASLEMKECLITRVPYSKVTPSGMVEGFEVIKYWLILKRHWEQEEG